MFSMTTQVPSRSRELSWSTCGPLLINEQMIQMVQMLSVTASKPNVTITIPRCVERECKHFLP
jgi:hypothetical protein